MEEVIPYVLVAILVIIISLRILKGRRKGIAALKIEIIYLLVYCFLGGFLTYLAISKFPSIAYAILFLGVFWAGLLIRIYPLFKQLDIASNAD